MPEASQPFMAAVYRLVRRIPRGHVLTYGEIAARLGRPHGARSVGHAMRVAPPDIPWHRVVNARGAISLRAPMSGMVTQKIRLEQEGVRLRAGRISLRQYRWRSGPSTPADRRRMSLRSASR